MRVPTRLDHGRVRLGSESWEFHMNATLAGLGLVLGMAMPALAQAQHPDVLVAPEDAKWGPAPPNFPPGAQVAVLSGNPFSAEPYVLRLKLPAGYVIPAHHHPTVENVTIVSGSFHAGMGDKLDRAHGIALAPGGFASLPANMNHFAWATEATVVQIHGMGPVAITYVDPADDPSRK